MPPADAERRVESQLPSSSASDADAATDSASESEMDAKPHVGEQLVVGSSGVPLTPATQHMCVKSFATILARLRPEIPAPDPPVLPSEKGGVFVTWSVKRGRDRHYALRGCIGTLTPTPVDAAVERYAAHAAFHDSRFDPIAASELPALKVGVSVLSAFELVDHVYDWQIGVHGIVLSLCNGRYSATYLPEVCAEHDWSKEFCVRSLAEKAGYRGILNEHTLMNASVTRYRSTKMEMEYDDYISIIQ